MIEGVDAVRSKFIVGKCPFGMMAKRAQGKNRIRQNIMFFMVKEFI
jgi:hypothetical protein